MKNDDMRTGADKGISYTERQLDEIAFPLGGIGTGCISLGGWGQLRDWEIFNRPNKGSDSRYTFFALHAKRKGDEPVSRILQGPMGGSYVTHGHGDLPIQAGLPHFESCSFVGKFPFAKIEFSDPKMPLRVAMEAFNPFIPLDDRNSSIPAAIFLFHLMNPGKRPVKTSILAALENLTGFPETGLAKNTVREGKQICGVMMTTLRHPADSPRFGTMAVASPFRNSRATARVFQTSSAPLVQHEPVWRFWRGFEVHGEPAVSVKRDISGENDTPVGGLVLNVNLRPGASVTLPVIVAWLNGISDVEGKWKTFSATLFKDGWDVAKYVSTNLKSLESRTRLFARRLFESSLPVFVKDAISSQISILKSPTCLRFEDGKFWGWEGCNDANGCCSGTCSHVWNYAQALPYLFPNLERTIREQHFDLDMDNEGRMCFRQPLPPGTKCDIRNFHPAADGQMGGVMRVYREWLISGDDKWLRKVWPACKKSLEYAWKYWDADKDGVMEGVQHNTYDNEFWGPNTMMGTLYLGALRASEEMARYLGETEKAEEYHQIFESGSSWIDKNLFNGQWYTQIINPEAGRHTAYPSNHLRKGGKIPRYQYGEGCLSDQLIGQWYSEMLGLGKMLKPTHIRKALRSIFRNNWKNDVSQHATFLRNFALAHEPGLIICTWPDGGEPPFPFWFATEVWCGIEYQVASHLIYEGFVEQGLSIAKGVRDRHDGTRRNPWDEFECGHHYSRSMASYSLLLALSGFSYSAVKRSIGFAPAISQNDFDCFFSVEGAWGCYSQRKRAKYWKVRLAVDEGCLRVKEICLSRTMGSAKHVRLNKKTVPFRQIDRGGKTALQLSRVVEVRADSPLQIRLG